MNVLNITQERLNEAKATISESPFVVKTPLIKNVESFFGLDDVCTLHLKLESLQKTGSFKTRGVVNQLAHLPVAALPEKQLVTMSAGNYGKAFAYVTQHLKLRATVVMPDHAPVSRRKIMEDYGAYVERVPVKELMKMVEKHVKEDKMHFVHPFDDTDLICGCASAGFEILDEIGDPDVVIVCCGGGGLLAGIATAFKFSDKKTRVFGAEPEGAPKMFNSLQAGEIVTLESVNTIASGLAPPMAGEKTFEVIKNFVEEIILVSDKELKRAMKALYDFGLVVEPAGAAAFATLLCNKIPNIEASSQVVVVVTGSNVTLDELKGFFGNSE